MKVRVWAKICMGNGLDQVTRFSININKSLRACFVFERWKTSGQKMFYSTSLLPIWTQKHYTTFITTVNSIFFGFINTKTLQRSSGQSLLLLFSEKWRLFTNNEQPVPWLENLIDNKFACQRRAFSGQLPHLGLNHFCKQHASVCISSYCLQMTQFKDQIIHVPFFVEND